MQKSKILFLIRAYNEGTRILSVLESIFDAGFDQILLVDDGSSDGTVQDLEVRFPGQITIIRHSINRGAGAALETGFTYIRNSHHKSDWDYVVTFDADGQHDIADMAGFMEVFENHKKIQVVYGSRFITKTRSNVPFFRRILLWGGKIFTSLISGAHLTDAHNGYRMFRRDVINHIHLTMDGMEYASELIDEVYMLGLSIREVPVNIHYDDYTLAKGQRYGGALRIMLRMLYKKIF